MSDKFNPAEYLRTLTKRKKVRDSNGQERWVVENHMYLDVKWRIVWFRNVYPNGCIDTKECLVNEQVARIEATIYDADPSSGGKCLAKARRQVNASDFRDYTEKAETQAIGRALALAGFGTQFCDELDEEGSLADSPVDTKATPVTPDNLYSIATQKGITKEDVDLILQYKYKKDASQLTSEEIASIAKGIESTPKERLQEFLAKFRAALEQQSVA